jgi:hypothetical protein
MKYTLGIPHLRVRRLRLEDEKLKGIFDIASSIHASRAESLTLHRISTCPRRRIYVDYGIPPVSVRLAGRNGFGPAARVSVLSTEAGDDLFETEDEELAVEREIK